LLKNLYFIIFSFFQRIAREKQLTEIDERSEQIVRQIREKAANITPASTTTTTKQMETP
jgi:hypothetical protein